MMRLLIVLFICFSVNYAASPPHHPLQDDKAMMDTFIQKDLDEFYQDVKTGNSLKPHYKVILSFLKDSQENDKILKETSMQIVSQLTSLYDIILKQSPDFSGENKQGIIEMLEKNVEDFKDKVQSSVKNYDFVIYWIELRSIVFRRGVTYDTLVDAQYDLLYGKKALKSIVEAFEEGMDVTKRTDVNENIINNTVYMLKKVMENTFDKHKENAVVKLQELVNEPTRLYPFKVKTYAISSIPF